ncbi:hypothetical protein Tco_0051822 [Tanacetum coccineum]
MKNKSQSNPQFTRIAVDILSKNFFRAFTASSTIPAIYIQQFWDTICFDSKARSYKGQLDEQWFDLTQDTLRDALQITTNGIHLSNVTTNDMFQPWRALATIINLCLTGKTSGFERPRAPMLQILWDVVNRASTLIYADKDCGINLLTSKANKTNTPKPTKQSKPTEPKAATKKSKSAPAKPQEKKRKPVSEPSEVSPLAKRAKAGKVVNERTEEAILQKVLEESLTYAYLTQRGPLPPVVFRETDTGKLQPLPEVSGKGKEKYSDTVSDEEMHSVVDVGLKTKAHDGTNPVQHKPEQLDEGFISHCIPEVQRISMLDSCMNRWIPERKTLKTTADTEAESMVSITIQQDTSVIPPMMSPVIARHQTTTLPLPPQLQQGPSDPIIIKRIRELEELIANLVEENQALEAWLDKQGSRINKINESVKEVVISSVQHAMRAPLCARFKDLPTFDMNGKFCLLACSRRKILMKSKQDSPKDSAGSPPSPPLLLHHRTGAIRGFWPKLCLRVVKLLLHHLRPHPSSGRSVNRHHRPKFSSKTASALKTTFVPPPENSLLAQTGDIVTFMDWSYYINLTSSLTKIGEYLRYVARLARQPCLSQDEGGFSPDVGLAATGTLISSGFEDECK